MGRFRHRGVVAWVPLLAIVALVLVFVPGAVAVHNEGLFELDGNAIDSPAIPGDDWDTIRNGASTTVGVSTFKDDVFNSNADDIFTGGSTKDDLDISGWLCKSGGAVDKNDIEHAFAAVYLKDGETFVYFGADKFSTSGDAQIGFWFLQDAVGCTPGAGASTSFTGTHQVGDILVLSDFTNGGNVSNIRVFRWVGTGGDTNGTLDLVFTGADCDVVAADDNVCAQVNPVGDEVAPWPYTPKSNLGPPGIFPKGSFYEGGINLTQLLSDAGTAVPCVGTYLVETRQSQSVDSVLEDFAASTVNTCPDVTIEKTPDGGTVQVGGSFDWDLQVTNNGAAATNVVVTDTIPAGLTINGATFDVDPTTAGGTGACVVTGQLVTCTIPSLGASDGNTTSPELDTALVKVNVTATAAAGPQDPAVACVRVDNTGNVTAANDANTDDNSDDGFIDVCRPVPEARISITPASATNEVGDPHTFTVTVEADPDLNTGGGFAPVAGAHVDFALTNGAGANAVLDAAASTCDNAGPNTDANGQCVIVFTSATAGTVTGNAAVTVFGLTRSTSGNSGPGGSGPAVKTFVDANIQITPQLATNPVGASHTFAAHVNVNDGTGFVSAPAGTLVTFSIVSGPGSFVGGTNTCTTIGTTGTCTVQINSAVAGTTVVKAATDVTVATIVLHRETGDGLAGDSGNATKTYVDANIQITPATATNPLGTQHTLTGHVNVNPGTGFVNAPAGTTINFSIVSGPGSFVGGTNSCTTVGTTGSCTVQITSAVAGTTVVKAATDVTVGTVVLHRETGDGLTGDSANATKTWAGAKIEIAASATNEVGAPHTFTVTVSRDTGNGFVPAPGEHVDFTLTNSNGGTFVLNGAASTCDDAGPNTNASGRCTIVFTSTSPGQVTGHASATIIVDGQPVTIETDGSSNNSGNAVKTFVDAYIAITPPEATNPTNTTHVYTAQVFIDAGNGAGYVAAPNGTLVTFTLLPGSVGSFVGGNTCTTTAGACTITTTSANAGNDTMRASATVTVGGVTMTRTTGQAAPGHANSGNAIKHWESPPPPPPAPDNPRIAIDKAPDLQTIPSGGTATWTIVVRNTGDVTLTNVRVTDAQAPGCARTQADIAALASMAPSASVTYSCSRANVTAGFTNVAVATGTPPSGPDVTASDDARVAVLLPAITIAKTPDQQVVMLGTAATFNITVTNSGQVTLTNVTITDAEAPGCARTQADIAGLASMAPGASVSYSCTRANVQASFTNVAVATGTPPFGANVTDDDDAVVTVQVPHPAISIVKNPKSQTVTSGGTATFEITVTNTGDVALTNVTVTDVLAPDCNRSLGTLQPGQSAPPYTCSRPNVTLSFDNVAIATGTPPVGPAVTATDTAPVTVTAPFTPPTTKPKPKPKPPKVVTKKKPKVTG